MKPRRQVCITGVTSAYLAKGVAELAGSANAFTVYVVRNNWADPTELADVRSTGTPVVQTLPQTFARFRLPPGQHELTVSWRSGATRTVVSGAAGEVKYLRVKGWAFWTHRDFSFWQIDRSDAVELTRDGKFIGDVESNPWLPKSLMSWPLPIHARQSHRQLGGMRFKRYKFYFFCL
jgi:hypothetical protein